MSVFNNGLRKEADEIADVIQNVTGLSLTGNSSSPGHPPIFSSSLLGRWQRNWSSPGLVGTGTKGIRTPCTKGR